MSESICPLCRQSAQMERAKSLYGTPVCERCYYLLANLRQLAYIIDWLAFYSLTAPAYFLARRALLWMGIAPDDAQQMLGVASWTLVPLAFTFKDGLAGRSLGKLLMGLQVVDRQTLRPIGFGQSLRRNLVLLVPLLPLIIAFRLQRGDRLGDRWANTRVIRRKYANHPVFTGRFACENCQYDLTGNATGICPECGQAVPMRFAPAQP